MFKRLRDIYRTAWKNVAKGMPTKQASIEAHQAPDSSGGELVPPTPQRVALRALCLTSVCFRGFLEEWPADLKATAFDDLQGWLALASLDHELETEEKRVLSTPPGKLSPRDAMTSGWRSEGLAVLAHAIGRADLPPHDTMVDPQPITRACGFLAPPEVVAEKVATASWSREGIGEALASRFLAVHWRLRQFMRVDQKPIDFPAFARGVEWAKFDLTDVPLANGDLAIKGRPITACDEQDLEVTASIVLERHTAANWLIGWYPIYSEVDTPT